MSFTFISYTPKTKSHKKKIILDMWKVRRGLHIDILPLECEPICITEQGLKNLRGRKWGGA